MLTVLLIISLFHQGSAMVDYGQDFITAFPENILSASYILKITALHDSTNFNVSFNDSNISTGTLNAGQTQAVNLSSQVEDTPISSMAVRVTSNKDITVFSISMNGNSVQTNVVQPVTNLGTSYLIPNLNFLELVSMLNVASVSSWTTPPDSYIQNIFSVLIINAEQKKNMVMVTLNVAGKSLATTIDLNPFEFVQIPGNSTLVKVNGSANISVLLTHPCLDALSCRCMTLVHQLRPANLGKSFLVPQVFFSSSSRMFLTSDQSVKLMYISPTFNDSLSFYPGSYDFLPANQPLSRFYNFTASQPVSLSLISFGSLVDLIPVSMFSACYLVHTTSTTQSQALVIVKTPEVKNVRLNSQQFNSSVVWKPIPGTLYSWLAVDLPSFKSQLIWHQSSKIMVYVLERTATGVPYGGPAISINDQPDPSGCLISPVVLEVSNHSLSWPESHRYCQQKGGNLASPSSSRAQKHMALNLTESGASGQAWIGLRRSLMTLEWYWQNGQIFSYFNWESQPLTPDMGMCAFVKMEPNGSYKWSSAQCCSPMQPMCLIPARYFSLYNPQD